MTPPVAARAAVTPPVPARAQAPHLGTISPKVAAALVRQHADSGNLAFFVRSSPAKLLGIAALVVAMCLLAGGVTAAAAVDRQHTLDTLMTETEPFANSAQRLYVSLSVADAAAATGFISGGIEPKDVRDRYTQAIGEASAALAVGSGSTDPQIRALLGGIATQLPVYTGLVETARTNNRIGYPVGTAYLAEASTLMQAKILPMADELHARQSAQVIAAQERVVQPPWLALVLIVAAVAALIAAQIYITRRWRRVFSVSLLVATTAMSALLIWSAVAGAISAATTDHALDEGTRPLTTLTQARILAQQARSDETLKLARRDTSGDYDVMFDEDFARLRTLLAEFPSDIAGGGDVAIARDAQTRWAQSHKRMNDALNAGDFLGASKVAVGAGPSDSAAAVAELDSALERGIAVDRDELRTNLSRAASALHMLGTGSVLLACVAVVAVAFGLWPRLREYR